MEVSGVRSSWLTRPTNWSFMRSVARASVMSVPTKFHPACTPRASVRGDRHRDGELGAVGGDVGPVPDIAALLLCGAHQAGQAAAGVVELLGQVELGDRPAAD